MKVFAHRGASGVLPENTMIAFYRGAELGADGIELDVHFTKDKHVVVIHDETIDRTTDGKGWVSEYTYEELKHFNANNKFGQNVGFCQIPLLADVFGWLRQNNLTVNVELKNCILPYEGLEEAVIDLVRIHGLTERTVLSTFNQQSVKTLATLAPDIETAALLCRKTKNVTEIITELNIASLHPDYKIVTKEMMAFCKERKINVRPYTVNKAEDIQRMIQVGCDTIITDFPEKIITNWYRTG